MDISVIVPIYGVEKYIEKSLRSLFSQTKASGVEYILVNDCTKDASMEIARRVIADFAHLDIKIIEHEQNRGVAVARQTGLRAAVGEYTIHFDPDDTCNAQMLEELYFKAKNEDADILVCDYIVRSMFDVQGKQDKYIKQSAANNGKECVNRLLRGEMHGSLWNKLIRRRLFVENNITFAPGINMWEDLLINCKVFGFAQKVSYLAKAYLYYVNRDTSISNSKLSFASNCRNYLSFDTEIFSFFKNNAKLEEYAEALQYRRVNIKCALLLKSNGEEQKKYAAIYPECNRFIFSSTALTFPYKIALLAASYGHLWLSNTVFKLIRLKAKFKLFTF